jgi:hypothetical protein
MTTWLSRLPIDPTDNADASTENRSMFRMLQECFATCRRARAAADEYEHLRRLSDRALAEKGLKREDLTRVAFDRLSEED